MNWLCSVENTVGWPFKVGKGNASTSEDQTATSGDKRLCY